MLLCDQLLETKGLMIESTMENEFLRSIERELSDTPTLESSLHFELRFHYELLFRSVCTARFVVHRFCSVLFVSIFCFSSRFLFLTFGTIPRKSSVASWIRKRRDGGERVFTSHQSPSRPVAQPLSW